jgi:hypothetical protein
MINISPSTIETPAVHHVIGVVPTLSLCSITSLTSASMVNSSLENAWIRKVT